MGICEPCFALQCACPSQVLLLPGRVCGRCVEEFAVIPNEWDQMDTYLHMWMCSLKAILYLSQWSGMQSFTCHTQVHSVNWVAVIHIPCPT